MPYKCKKDQQKYAKQHYLDNKVLYKARAEVHKKAARLRNSQYVYNYLLEHPCACGESDPVVLQFDHINRGSKDLEISNAINRPWSLKRLKEEILKCEVLCANCHLRRTAAQMSWHKNIKVL